MDRAARTPFRILSSHGLAVVILLLLMLLTYLGTKYQVEHGLFEAKRLYFDSLLVRHEFFGRFPVVLPGVYLLLVALAVNLVAGGLIRIRKGWNRAGILVTHFGILFLLFAGFVTFHHSVDGHLTLYESERSSQFVSYHEWEIAIAASNGDGSITEHLVPGRAFEGLGSGESSTFRADDLPFEITISNFLENCRPLPAGPVIAQGHEVIEGAFLQPLPREPESERNIAGAVATVTGRDGRAIEEGFLWGLARAPLQVRADGKLWNIDLRKRRWSLPFTIVLDDFTRELHPRTSMASSFESDVTMIEGGNSRKINISMNRPLRHRGYTLFQASWGPQNAGPNQPLFSTFAVVRNPADQFPLIACIVIALGLVLHFGGKLLGYLRRESAKSR